MKKQSRIAALILASLIGSATLPAFTSFASVMPTGDISPANPTTWTSSTIAKIGNTSVGELDVSSGSALLSGISYIGYGAGSNGTVVVDGSGSRWSSSSTAFQIGPSLFVGEGGTGTMSITNGGVVRSVGGVIGDLAGSTGLVIIDGPGSSWTTSGLGTAGMIYVGNLGNGTLKITNGAKFNSGQISSIGGGPDSTGAVVVDGAGSVWTLASSIVFSDSGNSTLSITNSGMVRDNNVILSSGTVTVDGTGSIWSNATSFDMGSPDGSIIGTVNITNGGKIAANQSTAVYTAYTEVYPHSIFSVNVGDGSQFNGNAGAVYNYGIIRLKGVPGMAAGTYTPFISSGTWSGNGVVQALGGIWNSVTQTFAATAAATGNTDLPVGIDLSQTQRILFTDPTSTDNCVQLAFQGTASTSSLTITAKELNSTQRGSLMSDLPIGANVLSGWTFTANGYTTGNPVFLSMDIGSGYTTSELTIWHFIGSSWVPIVNNDLSYDGTYASFTASDLRGYAVTGVPEPTSLSLLVLVVGGLLIRRFRA